MLILQNLGSDSYHRHHLMMLDSRGRWAARNLTIRSGHKLHRRLISMKLRLSRQTLTTQQDAEDAECG